MQGVQPKAKARPIKKAPKIPEENRFILGRRSTLSQSIFRIPKRCRPKITITVPAIFVKNFACPVIKVPIKEAEAPNDMKITEKPNTKNIDVKPAFLIIFLRWAPPFSSSKDIPDRNEIYPGIKGNIQGERKERTPAIKAMPIEIWFIFTYP